MTINDEIASALQETAKLKADTFTAISDALAKINQSNLEAERIPNGNETINGVQARLTGLCTLAEQITQDTYDWHLVSLDYLKKFKDAVQAINSAQAEILSNLQRVEQHGGFGTADSNLVISNKANDQNYALGQGLINLDNSIDRGLERYYLLSPSITRPDATKLSSFTRDFEAILDELKQAKASAKRDATQLAQKLAEIEQAGSAASGTVNNINTALSDANKHRDDAKAALDVVTGIQTQANEKVPIIEATYTKAEDLKKKIESHHEKLDEFDEEIESRVAASEEGKEKLKLLIQNFEKQKEDCDKYVADKQAEVEQLITRAEAMLGLSTSAGLGDTFKQQANSRGTAIICIYVLIAVALSAIAGIGIWAGHEGVSEIAFLFKLAAIIPLGILVSIATKTLRKLEQSKEYYEHKASVSQAVEGYRKLYEGTDNNDRSELIKNTVAEVLKNPADSLSQATKEDVDLIGSLDKLTDICKKMTGK